MCKAIVVALYISIRKEVILYHGPVGPIFYRHPRAVHEDGGCLRTDHCHPEPGLARVSCEPADCRVKPAPRARVDDLDRPRGNPDDPWGSPEVTVGLGDGLSTSGGRRRADMRLGNGRGFLELARTLQKYQRATEVPPHKNLSTTEFSKKV